MKFSITDRTTEMEMGKREMNDSGNGRKPESAEVIHPYSSPAT